MNRLASIGLVSSILLAGASAHAGGGGGLAAPSGGGYVAAFPDSLGIGDQVLSGTGTVRYGRAFLTISTGTGATVIGNAPDTPSGIFNVISSYSYQGELTGPALDDVQVDLQFAIALTTVTGQFTEGSASLYEPTAGPTLGAGVDYRVGVGFYVQSGLTFFQSGALVLTINTDTPFNIGVSGETTGGSFYVDPMVTLDPAWAAANPAEAAQLSFSFDGVPNQTGGLGVPEPSMWVMMTAGAGLLGAALRGRTRRKAARATA